MSVVAMLEIPTPIWVALVAFATSLLTNFLSWFLAARVEGAKLSIQHRYEQRHELSELIAKYHGRMLEAAVDWDRRMWQLYEPDGRVAQYLDVREKSYSDGEQYLFRSYVYRFLALCALARKFEAEAYYIDAQYARPADFEFLKYAKAFLWAMTHANLTPNDGFPGRDHFANDQFRPVLDLCYREERGISCTKSAKDEIIFDFRRFDDFARSVQHIRVDGSGHPDTDCGVNGAEGHTGQEWHDLLKAFEFFNGLGRPGDGADDGEGKQRPRYRLDRLVVLHLLAMGLINEFGYPWQRKKDEDIRKAVHQIRYACIAASLYRAIPRTLGLGELNSRRHGNSDRWRRLSRRQWLRRHPRRSGMDPVREELRRRACSQIGCDECPMFAAQQRAQGDAGSENGLDSLRPEEVMNEPPDFPRPCEGPVMAAVEDEAASEGHAVEDEAASEGHAV